MTTKMLMSRAGHGLMALGAMVTTTAALATGNLAGGPAVNQLDLHPPITKIASEV